MISNTNAIHVNPVGGKWEVETEASTLGQTETQPEAVELAVELAPEVSAQKVQVHTSDGQVEKEIAIPRPEGSTKQPASSPGRESED